MKKVIVNNGREDSKYNIEGVEKKYNAKYVGQHTLKGINGEWIDDSIGDFFYQENPPLGYSKYMVLFVRDGLSFISTGCYIDGLEIQAIKSDDGEIIYSRNNHDYRVSKDKSVWIDGGRSYTRGPTSVNYMTLKIIDGEFYEVL